MEEEVLLAAVDPGIPMPEASPAEPAARSAQGPEPGTPDARPTVPEAQDGPAVGVARGETPELEEQALQKDSAADSLDSPEDIAEHDVSAIISSMTKYTRLAMSCRKKDQTTRAIKQMNLALGVCDGRESAHPAVAVEAARVRLNLGAMLSRGGRHLEALVAIKDAQRGLHSVLAWVGDCGAGDPGVVAIEKEARSLQCAAVVAEAIELEPYSQNDNSSSSELESLGQESEAPAATVRMVHEQLYAKAKSLAETCLAPSHPVASLAKKLSTEGTAPARPLVCKRSALPSPAAPSPTFQRARPSMFARGVLPADVSRPPGARADAADRGGGDAPQARYTRSARSSVDSTGPNDDDPKRPASSKGRPKGARSTSAGAVSLGRTNRHGGSRGGEGHDLFAAFLRDAAEEKEARRGAFADSWQDDARKRLAQVHKRTRLLLQLSEDVELKDKKYTTNGHKVMMESLTKDNKSRSDPALVKEARSNRDIPEVYQVRKLNRKLYVKPQTPQPPPPPPRPLMDDDIAQIFRRPTPNQSPTNF